jgi:hypothetical protein
VAALVRNFVDDEDGEAVESVELILTLLEWSLARSLVDTLLAHLGPNFRAPTGLAGGSILVPRGYQQQEADTLPSKYF